MRQKGPPQFLKCSTKNISETINNLKEREIFITFCDENYNQKMQININITDAGEVLINAPKDSLGIPIIARQGENRANELAVNCPSSWEGLSKSIYIKCAGDIVQSTAAQQGQQFSELILSSATQKAGFVEIQIIAQDTDNPPKTVKTAKFKAKILSSLETPEVIMQSNTEGYPVTLIYEAIEAEEAAREEADNTLQGNINTKLDNDFSSEDELFASPSTIFHTNRPEIPTLSGKTTIANVGQFIMKDVAFGDLTTTKKFVFNAINELVTADNAKLDKDFSSETNQELLAITTADILPISMAYSGTRVLRKLTFGNLASWILGIFTNTINTTAKTITGAINELFGTKTDKDTVVQIVHPTTAENSEVIYFTGLSGVREYELTFKPAASGHAGAYGISIAADVVGGNPTYNNMVGLATVGSKLSCKIRILPTSAGGDVDITNFWFGSNILSANRVSIVTGYETITDIRVVLSGDIFVTGDEIILRKVEI